MPIAVFAVWLVITTVLLLKAIKRQAAEAEASTQPGQVAVGGREPAGAHA